jgi:hypothetical protein
MVLMFLLYAPALLLQQISSNIFVNGAINGVSQFATIPFLPFLNANVSRRKGMMGMFACATFFTLLQYFLNPSGCTNCHQGAVAVLLMVFFFASRFFVNLVSNFFLSVGNESFPAQVRSICYLAVVGVGRVCTLMIPYLPALKQSINFSYNLLFVAVGLMGMMSGYLIR